MHLIALERVPSLDRGGQEKNLLEICRDLVNRGHKVTLLYEREGNSLDQYREFCESVWHVDAYGFDRRRPKTVLQFFRNVAGMGKIPVYKDSIVFSNTCHTVTFGYALSRFRRLPFVCYFQTPFSSDLNRQNQFALAHTDRYIAVSHQTKQTWVEFGLPDSKIEVVHNGTDLSQFKPPQDFLATRQQWGISEHAKVVSYAGRIDPEKGIEYLIKAVALLATQEPDIKLMIAGRPVVHINAVKGTECEDKGMNYQRSLEQLAKDLGIGDRVQFVGHLSDPASLYQISDVSVLPSIWAEPFGRSIIESLACGTPVVASRAGGIPEILTGELAANLVPARDEKALAKGLSEVIHWRETDPGLGQRCSDHVVNHFSLESMIGGVEKTLLSAAKT
ncbi:MAG: glycosyltransferase family 4 protein [Candidatus Parcubacteria bacterium]|nr:glycosyltransferase family 4 protein [Leptolyngbyaceae cyanobacterium LF-bin-113]